MNDLEKEKQMIEEAVSGNQAALEALLSGVQDMVFNLSLRMLGTKPDAEDATQEILIKIMTRLSSFRQECRLSTWVFRIAVNHLKNDRKGRFSHAAFSFEAYGADIVSGKEKDIPDKSGGADRELLERELKYSCTNVMLQCLDAQSRCIFVLGTMFRLNSKIAADILEMTPEAYRQKLSRIRRKVADFLRQYCGLSGSGLCSCKRRIDYAIESRRIDPANLDYCSMKPCNYTEIIRYTDAMEELDELSQIFAGLPAYRVAENTAILVSSDKFNAILRGPEATI